MLFFEIEWIRIETMLVTITTTHQPATDLGFLLHKHPDKVQSIDLSVGKAHIYYPESTAERSTVALLLDIDPIAMVRGSKKLSGKGFSLGQYVNDRPYVASSFMSVALSKAFSTAMNGTCATKPHLVNEKLPLAVKIAVLPAPRGGEALIRKLFEPLGYTVALEQHRLDEQFTQWGDSKYFTLCIEQHVTVQELLSHLYVLIPVLDNDKHYFVSEEEIEKLLSKGKGWLGSHPEKEQIAQRYLINLSSYSRKALERLSENQVGEEEALEENTEEQEKRESLHQKRLNAALEAIKDSGAQKVIDLGCGEGKLLKLLLKEKQFTKITGIDISYSTLLKAKERLRMDRMTERQLQRIELFQSALTYRDQRLDGYDAAAVVEVIEHMDQNRLRSFERSIFACSKPGTVVVTTPNAEYNQVYEMEEGRMRHSDHRFEWTRNEFETWATTVAQEHGYQVSFKAIGELDETHGASSQMAVFTHGD